MRRPPSTHDAQERQARHAERSRAFVEEALAADRAIDEGAEVYAAADVHAWLARRALGAAGWPRPLVT